MPYDAIAVSGDEIPKFIFQFYCNNSGARRPLDNVRLGKKLCRWYLSPWHPSAGRGSLLPESRSGRRVRKNYWCNDIVIIIIIDERTATLTIPVWGWWWRTRASPPIYRSWTFGWRATVTIRTRTRRSETLGYFSGSAWKTQKNYRRYANGQQNISVLSVYWHYCRQQVFHERRRR